MIILLLDIFPALQSVFVDRLFHVQVSFFGFNSFYIKLFEHDNVSQYSKRLIFSAHTIEFQYLTGTPTHIAEIIGALELIILPCQCTFLFIMIRCWHGHPISDFLPKGPRERKWIFVLMTVLVLATIGTLMWAQISGFI